MLEEGQAISKIAKEVNITRLFIELNTIIIWFNKLYFDTNELLQRPKTDDHNLL